MWSHSPSLPIVFSTSHSGVVKKAAGDSHVPSTDEKRELGAETLIKSVCDELGDVIATIVHSRNQGLIKFRFVVSFS